MTPRVTVSILTYTALRQAKACIASFLKSTSPFKLILTANGNPEAAAYFTGLAKEFPFITVVVNEKNEGFIAPNRHALSLCDTELFVMANDDILVPPDALEKIAEPFDRFPKAALAGLDNDFQTLLPNFHGTKGKSFEYLNGAFLACKTEIVKKHGLFDPNIHWAYSEDSDLSLRMRELGYTLHKVDIKIHHEIAATSRHVKEVRQHQEANHAYCRKRWAHYLKVRKMDFPVVVKRTAAFGDVLLTTPIIRALREKHPLSPIYVETATPQIFLRNPHVKEAQQRPFKMGDAMIYNLDGAYESKTNQHIVGAYAEKCEVSITNDRTDFFLSDQEESRAMGLVPDGDWVAVHSGPSTWRSKEWPLDRFAELIKLLRAGGHRVVLVGSQGRPLEADLDERGKTTIHEMGAIIKRAKLFVGLDSLPIHVAQAVGTPVVGLFGITDPKFIMTSGSPWRAVCGSTPSFGLRHRVVGQNVVDDGSAAMNSISVHAVVEVVASMLNAEPAIP